MPAINFSKEFADKVENGEKLCTIRKERKRPIKQYDYLYFFTGQRTCQCRAVGGGICTKVQEIVINRSKKQVFVDKVKLTTEQLEILAKNDGFNNIDSFYDFFTSQTEPVFIGQIIHWIKHEQDWRDLINEEENNNVRRC